MIKKQSRPLGQPVPLSEVQLDAESVPSEEIIPEIKTDAEEMSPLVAALINAKTEE